MAGRALDAFNRRPDDELVGGLGLGRNHIGAVCDVLKQGLGYFYTRTHYDAPQGNVDFNGRQHRPAPTCNSGVFFDFPA